MSACTHSHTQKHNHVHPINPPKGLKSFSWREFFWAWVLCLLSVKWMKEDFPGKFCQHKHQMYESHRCMVILQENIWQGILRNYINSLIHHIKIHPQVIWKRIPPFPRKMVTARLSSRLVRAFHSFYGQARNWPTVWLTKTLYERFNLEKKFRATIPN